MSASYKNNSRSRADANQPSGDNQKKHMVRYSRALSKILRHSAQKQGIPISSDGYVNLKHILAIPSFKAADLAMIQQIVDDNDKKRFHMYQHNKSGDWFIRANQGHSMKLDIEMEELTEPIDTVIHGTYREKWQSIATSGLSRMSRQHIHFASGMPGENGVISGMRSSCQVIVFVDMEAAMKDGIKFFRSANGVILSDGLNGTIPPQYFKRVVDRRSGSELEY
uniref:2'-phosphotransferase n=1 Tax=Percolomonas cosmopolitus TaxID=63605 RepID=A0A7S1KLI4_9EUKA